MCRQGYSDLGNSKQAWGAYSRFGVEQTNAVGGRLGLKVDTSAVLTQVGFSLSSAFLAGLHLHGVSLPLRLGLMFCKFVAVLGYQAGYVASTSTGEAKELHSGPIVEARSSHHERWGPCCFARFGAWGPNILNLWKALPIRALMWWQGKQNPPTAQNLRISLTHAA